jgi:hypothetical protein
MSEGKDLRFGTDKVDLEVEVGIETEIGGKGEVRFRFLVVDTTVGADGKSTFVNKQTVKMSLFPVYRGRSGRLMIAETADKPPV